VTSYPIRDPGNPTAELCPAEAGRSLVVVDVGEWKGPEVLYSRSNVNSRQGLRLSPTGLKVNSGQGPRLPPPGLNVSLERTPRRVSSLLPA